MLANLSEKTFIRNLEMLYLSALNGNFWPGICGLPGSAFLRAAGPTLKNEVRVWAQPNGVPGASPGKAEWPVELREAAAQRGQ